MEYLIFGAVILAVFIAAILMGIRNERRTEKLFRAKLKKNYGSIPDKEYGIDAFVHIPKYFEKHPYTDQIDDITWNDLDMDEVFRRVNYCLSDAGEELLYDRLRKPLQYDDADFERMEKHIAYYDGNEKARLDASVIFVKLKSGSRFSVYDHLDHIDNLEGGSNAPHAMMLAWMVLMIVGSFIFFFPCFPLLITLIILNLVFYFRQKNNIDQYLGSFNYLLRLLKGAEQLSALLKSEYDTECVRLDECTKALRAFRLGAGIVMSPGRMSSGNPLDLIMDYVRMITHIDLMKFNQMLTHVKAHKTEIDDMIRIVGNMEADLSVTCYRASLADDHCAPVFTEGKRHLMEDAYHPLLRDPVRNSIDTEKGVLITGSNASGKSTFLKMCAICALFAQTIHTVPAKRYEAPVYRIFSSMALTDNLIGGDSYYIVEIKSLKRILDAAKEEGRILCFVDEVLRGTNTVERIAASAKILEHFASLDVLCFAATHDIELSALLKEKYMNFHFEGEVRDNDVRFNYKIQEGAAKTRNAIRLLSLMGYEESIVDSASSMAERFVSEGEWSM